MSPKMCTFVVCLQRQQHENVYNVRTMAKCKSLQFAHVQHVQRVYTFNFHNYYI